MFKVLLYRDYSSPGGSGLGGSNPEILLVWKAKVALLMHRAAFVGDAPPFPSPRACYFTLSDPFSSGEAVSDSEEQR